MAQLTDAALRRGAGSGAARTEEWGQGMTDRIDALATGLGSPPGRASVFAGLAAALGHGPVALLRRMVERVVAMDEDMRALGLRGVARWTSGSGAAENAAERGLRALPPDVRTTGLMWPPGVPSPWSAEECRAWAIRCAGRAARKASTTASGACGRCRMATRYCTGAEAPRRPDCLAGPRP